MADFGLSRFVDRDTTTLTSTSLAAGTLGYMPPEYSKGKFKDGTIQGDIYMAGKTLYYLFSNGGDVSNVRINRVPLPIATIVEKQPKKILKIVIPPLPQLLMLSMNSNLHLKRLIGSLNR